MKKLLFLVTVLVTALGACSQRVPETHYVRMEQAAILKVHYTKETTILDSTLYCGHEVNTFVFRPDSVFLVDSLKNSEDYKIVGQIEKGLYMLSDGGSVPILLHLYEVPVGGKKYLTVYFQRGRYIMRFSQYKDLNCDKL